MGLIARYILNKNYEDYSGNKITPTNYGDASMSTSGKTSPNCWLFVDRQYLTIPIDNYYFFDKLTNVTITFWRKNYEIGNWLPFSGQDANHYILASLNGTGDFYHSNAGNPKVYVDGIESNTPYQDGKWHHYAITNVDLSSWVSLVLNNHSDGWRNTGYLNDIRIYDNNLSSKEIYEISKGKILHHTLTDFKESSTNLLNSYDWLHMGSEDFYGWQATYGTSMSLPYLTTLYDAGPFKPSAIYEVIVSGINGGGISSIVLKLPTGTISGIKYTFSCWYKSAQRASAIYCDDAWGDNEAIGIIQAPADGFWHKVVCYFTSSASGFINIYLEFESGLADDKVQIAAPMLEQKDHETDFSWEVKNDKVKDSSEFNNHSSVSDTYSPSPSLNYKINDSSCYFKSMNNSSAVNGNYISNTSMYLPPETFTISFWAYRTENGFQGGSYFSIGGYGQVGIDTYDDTCSLIRNNGTILASIGLSTTIGQWDFVTITLDYNYFTSYINGVLNTQSACQLSYPHTNDSSYMTAYIGYSKAGGAHRFFNGYLNDFRIYATALSINEIQNLYKTRHSLDNNGNFYSLKFNENDNLIYKSNIAIKDKIFGSGVWYYNQANCLNDLTDAGYNIYRPANLTVANNGNTMFGGLRFYPFNIYDNIIQKNHKYKISFTVRGKSSNDPGYIYFSNNMGNGGGGLTSVLPYEYNTLGVDFQGEKEVYACFNITDDVYKVCTTSYDGFLIGIKYNCYKDLCWSFENTDTGTLGTDLYLTNFKIVDITNNDGKSSLTSFKDNSICSASELNEMGPDVFTDGLVGWWKLNSYDKTTLGYSCDLRDYSGNGNHARDGYDDLMGFGDENRLAYGFTGNYGLVINNDKLLQLEESISISAWIYPQDISTNGNIFSKNGNSGYRCRVQTDGTFWWYVSGNLINGGIIITDEWSHVVATGDASGLKIYINGILINSKTTPYSPTSAINGNGNIGQYDSGSERFIGGITDVRLYNRALSQTDVSILYDETYRNQELKIGRDKLFTKKELNEINN